MDRIKLNTPYATSTFTSSKLEEQDSAHCKNHPSCLVQTQPNDKYSIMDSAKCAKSFPNYEAFANHTRTEHSDLYTAEEIAIVPLSTNLIQNFKVEIENEEQLEGSSREEDMSPNDVDDSNSRHNDSAQPKIKQKEYEQKEFNIVVIKEERDAESLQEAPNTPLQADISGNFNPSLHTETDTPPEPNILEITYDKEDLNFEETSSSLQIAGNLVKGKKRNIAGKGTKKITSQPDQKRFACDMCPYKCNKKSNLKQHNRIHSGEKPFACDLCDYRCNKKEHLKNHSRTHTGEKPFACNLCDYRCTQKEHLKNHSRIHTGVTRFACDVCDYKCNHRIHLEYHSRTHTGEKPFSCQKCDYRCSTKGSLKQHLIRHTDEKPFACNLCDYKCNNRGNLRQHSRIHSGEKPFACHICEYKCGRKDQLREHVRNHTGEKRFACDLCDYRCKQKDTLKYHTKVHTGDKPFACEICDFRCRKKFSLTRHVKTHNSKAFT